MTSSQGIHGRDVGVRYIGLLELIFVYIKSCYYACSTTMNGPIDVDKLEKELVSALEADRRYSRENDAKFRAVNQRVATYEEFRLHLT